MCLDQLWVPRQDLWRIPHGLDVPVFHGLCSPLVDHLTAADKAPFQQDPLEGQTGDCSVGHTSDFFFDCCLFSALFTVEQSSSKWWRHMQAVRKMQLTSRALT